MQPRLAPKRASSEQQRSKVGFPIRKFTDQSLFAAPHDLSQRTTSFIASQRQGIHQIPLRHLIALIAKARVGGQKSEVGVRSRIRFLISFLISAPKAPWREKTSFASNASGDLSGQAPNPRLVAERTTDDRETRTDMICLLNVPRPSSDNRMRFLFTMSDIEGPEGRRQRTRSSPSAFRPSQTPKRFWRWAKLIDCIGTDFRLRRRRPSPSSVVRLCRPPSVLRQWWSQTGSNRRPHACKARALPTELWPRRREGRGNQNSEDRGRNAISDFRFPSSAGGPGRT